MPQAHTTPIDAFKRTPEPYNILIDSLKEPLKKIFFFEEPSAPRPSLASASRAQPAQKVASQEETRREMRNSSVALGFTHRLRV